MISQFRPISLCNVINKLITKTVVNRLKPILGDIVSSNQGSFVPGWHITNNINIGQEIIHTMRMNKGNGGGVIIMIQRRHTTVWNGILLQMHYRRSDYQCLIDIIVDCISSGRFRLLQNGKTMDVVSPSRGLCHGDSISSY